MKNFVSLSANQQRIYLAWVFTPVGAHILSGLTGFLSLLIFPILVTIGYYLFFRQYLSARHPAWWLLTLPLTVYIWLKWGPATTYLDKHSILPGVTAYYVGQLINSFTIPLLFKEDYADTFIGWLVAHTVAMIVWLAFCAIPADTRASHYQYAYFLVYPVIGLAAQGLSGLFLFGKYTVN